MRYSSSYRESITLADGVAIEIRAIQPSDHDNLARAFRLLSAKSRYRRFHSAKSELSEEELRYFTECDGINHFALVAIAADGPQDAGGGVGVARFVRLPTDPAAAEVAVVVIDQWQRRGIGRRLLTRVAAAAAERGIQRVVAVAQADNEQIGGLLKNLSDDLEVSTQNELTTISFPVSKVQEPGANKVVIGLLRLVALGTLLIPIRFGEKSLAGVLKSRGDR